MNMNRNIALCIGLILFAITSIAGASDIKLTRIPAYRQAPEKLI